MQIQSIGELIDRLIIENMKIWNLRAEVNDITDPEDVDAKVAAENKMNICNENRGAVIEFLDRKITGVMKGTEPNVVLRQVKTYEK